MARYAAFLRAVNVGGTGKLPMSELKTMCEAAGFSKVKTYIASGNVVFETALPRQKAQAALEKRLADYAGAPVGLHLRAAEELEAIIRNNAFPEAEGNRLVVILLAGDGTMEMVRGARNQSGELIAPGKACLYVHYGSGMAQSRLRIPGTEAGTGRNMNTIKAMLKLLQA